MKANEKLLIDTILRLLVESDWKRNDIIVEQRRRMTHYEHALLSGKRIANIERTIEHHQYAAVNTAFNKPILRKEYIFILN